MSIPKFDGTNFDEWNFVIETYASAIDALGILDGTETAPTDPAELATFNKRQMTLFTALVFSQTSATQKYVRNATPKNCPRAAYLELLRTYNSSSQAAIQQHSVRLTTMQQNSRSAIDFITDIIETADKLDSAIKSAPGVQLLDILKMTALIRGLDHEHAPLKEVLLIKEGLDFKTACDIVLERSERLRYEDSTEDISALTAKFRKNGKHHFSANNKPPNPCPECLKHGKTLYHWKTDCFLLHPEKAPPTWEHRPAGQTAYTRIDQAASAW